jgi:hypothetical protein
MNVLVTESWYIDLMAGYAISGVSGLAARTVLE